MASISARSRLAVYGSLAPGERHHDQLAHLRGTWQPATVRGRIVDRGWRRGEGYPGFVAETGADRVDVHLFTSSELEGVWRALDRFEGRQYRRIVVPVELTDGTVVEASIYELRPEFVPD